MSTTYTTSFTRTHAREIASRVAADLRLMHRLYGRPSLSDIDDYEAEFVELLVNDYLKTMEYGFERDGNRVVSLRYTVRSGSGEPDRAGSVYATADTAGAAFFSFLKYREKYFALTQDQKDSFWNGVPVRRTPGSEPGNGNGYWAIDKTYGAGGVEASRETFRPF